MAFELAAAYVEISADTTLSDKGIASVRSDLKTLPKLQVVGLKADTTGFDAGLAHAKKELAAYELASDHASYGLGDEPRGHVRATPFRKAAAAEPFPTLDTGQVTQQIEGVRQKLIRVGQGTTLRLRVDDAGLVAGLARAKGGLATLPGMKTIKIVADATGLTGAIAKAKGALAGLDLKSIAAGAAGGLGIGAGIAAIQGAFGGLAAGVKGAADLGETMSKVDVVFGAAAGKVHGFAESMSEAFGTSRQEVLDSAAGFGLIAKAAGQSKEQAAELSVNFARLADDASSFYNVPLAEALGTIKSALVGESEPIRRFGVLLNEDAVKAEALRLGLKGVGKELSESSKVMARASLIQKGMADAQGDHARTAGSFTNQWREFTGRVYDLAVTLGSVALPVLNTFLRVLNPIAQALKLVADQIANVIGGVQRFAGAVSEGAFGRNVFEAAGSAAPGAGAGKALPPEGPGEAAAAAEKSKFGIDAARKSVADAEKHTAQERLVEQARTEAAQKRKLDIFEKQNLALHKHLWVERQIAQLDAARARMSDSQRLNSPVVPDAERRKNLEAAYTTEVGGQSGASIGKGVGGADATQARRTIDAWKSIGKDKITQLFDFKADLRQKTLGAVGAGLALIEAKGAPVREKREKLEREGYQTQFFQGGQDYSNAIQAAALGDKKNKAEEKEIAKNTAAAVQELKNGFGMLVRTIKDIKGGAVLQ